MMAECTIVVSYIWSKNIFLPGTLTCKQRKCCCCLTNMARQDHLLHTIIIFVIYILTFHFSYTSVPLKERMTDRYCILQAIELYKEFTFTVCRNHTNSDHMQWLPERCLYMCKISVITDCKSSNINTLIQLNISAATGNIYFPISQYESGKCTDCQSIKSIVIKCNIDSVFDVKDCSGLLSTDSTRPTTITNILTYPAETTNPTTACKPCPLTSTMGLIATNDPSTLSDIVTKSTLAERKCQTTDTMSANSSPLGKENDIPMQYLAATGIGGVITGTVLTLLFVFLFRKRSTHMRSPLAEEQSIENPAYSKNHRFYDQVHKTHMPQNEEYSEIQHSFYSGKGVNKNSPKTTKHIQSKDRDNDYDHLNDAFDTDTNDQSMYDHAQYISKTHLEQRVDKVNGQYTPMSQINEGRSYVEVTGEGSEGFSLDNQKQPENASNDHYFVLKKQTK